MPLIFGKPGSNEDSKINPEGLYAVSTSESVDLENRLILGRSGRIVSKARYSPVAADPDS